MSPHPGVVLDSLKGVERLHINSDVELTDAEKAVLVARLREAMSDVLEVVPPGQPVTCVRHAASLYLAPGQVLRETQSENSGEGVAR